MRRNSLAALYVDQLKALYSASEQHLDALPHLIKAASTKTLQQLLRDVMADKTEQLERLEQLLSAMNETPHGKHCQGVAGLIREADTLVHEHTEAEVLDAALIAAAQRIAHYEIAGYSSAESYAGLLAQEQAQRILHGAKAAQWEFDTRLNQLALDHIYPEALHV